MADAVIGMGPQDQAERDRFESELRRILQAAEDQHLVLRVLGSLAFQLHCPRYGFLQSKLGRAYTDIDFASYGKHARAIRDLFAKLGYAEDREVFVVTEGGRAIFENPATHLHVDVFYEKLDFSHVIPWNGRLESDRPTIPLAELLLEKMQIVKINEKDVIDTIMLLLEHPLGDNDSETIHMGRVAALCASDWGLWRTVTMNLGKVGLLAEGYAALEPPHKSQVAGQVQAALLRIDAEPKSMAWRLRSRVGDRVKWYKDVEEV